MSSPSQTAAPSSIFKSMLDAALDEYKKKTGKNLLAHWLADELKSCESVDGVLNILRDQAKTFEPSGDQKLMKWIDPLVHVIYTFSGALGDGVSLAFPPARVIFTGIGVLLIAAKGARASHGAVIDLFERIESFFKRLRVYTQNSLSTEMAEVLVKIVIELLSILSIATKEVKRRRAKIFARKLLGRTDIEDALKRLNSLIQEEFQTVAAQTLKVATEAKNDADRANTVVQQNMEEVKRDVLDVKRDVEEIKWTQIEKDIHKWFSPPDPSTNYNIACETHQEGTAAWFFQGNKFKDWTEIASLLWIHGKPGSGKSILCSMIIKHVISLRDAAKAALAYFYFDFRDKDKKQDFRNFVTSLLVQLSAYSSPCCEIISRIYSTHGKGTREPNKDALTNCLREMLLAAGEQPIYIIIDALDECPDSSGIRTPREVVLNLLGGLVRLRLPNLHICVTSRPENDIKKALGPLASGSVSLHDESGQMKDIDDYVRKVVYSDNKMRRLRDDEKELIVRELSERADGMFRWVYCQLEVLRHCIPASIRQTLNQLPKSLDETYLRVLSQIPQANQAYAHRMLQCLVVAVRPLAVEELAELLAFDFDAVQGGIPKYRAVWRLDDQTEAILSICSSLVTVVKHRWDGRLVVQFSHFSVKEFLISDRLASALGDFSHCRIHHGPAHTIFTQACLGILLYLDDHTDKEMVKGFPLAQYAAQHWVKHAQFEDVASRVGDGIETLFDSDKPHLSTWIGIYDMDTKFFGRHRRESPNPLYYSVLCGFYDLVKHLAIKYPQYVNGIYGRYKLPLLAALGEDHIDVAELLLEHGANVNVRDIIGETMLLKAFSQSRHSLVRKVKFLLKHGADVNSQDNTLTTSLHLAEKMGELEVAQILVKHKADVNAQNNEGKTPLHILLGGRVCNEDDVLNHVRLLLGHGAKANRQDNSNQTPLHLSMGGDWFKVARILLEHGVDASAENDDGETPLHLLSESRIQDEGEAHDLIRLLLEHGAAENRRDKRNQTLLLWAMGRNWFKVARILLEHGVDASMENCNGKTPLHLLSESRIHDEGEARDLIQLLLKHGATVNRQDKSNQTPLHLAMGGDWFKIVRILLEHDADASAENDDGETPLHLLSKSRIHDEGETRDLIRLLLEHGATVNKRDKSNQTPLHLAMGGIWFKIARILLEHDADASAENDDGKTPLHLLSESRIYDEGEARDLIRLLLKHGATVNRQDKSNQTPLYLAMGRNRFKVARVLLEHGADASAVNDDGKTSLHLLSESRIHDEGEARGLIRLLLEYGATVNRRDKRNQTPLHLAMGRNLFKFARILFEHDADASVEDNNGKTPLNLVSEGRIHDEGEARDLIRLLLEHGASANRQDKRNQTLLLWAMGRNWFKVAQIHFKHGADARMENNNSKIPLHLVSENRIHDEGEARDLIRLLLEHGATVNRRDKIQFLNEGDVLEQARLLLEHGAEADSSNRKPLLLAMGQDWFELAQILIEHGADAEAKDGADKTNMVMKQDMEEVKRHVLEVKWTQIERKVNKWLSSPDPSTNYNIACVSHYGGTATWFLEGMIFEDWLERGSLLWIHGKPGTGKSILCSMIIKHVISLRDAGLASLAYFYFDFREKVKKQDFGNFVASLLIQLSTYSNLCCKIISRFYSTHGEGMQQPNNHALKGCLREMLSVAARQPTYIIIDALDECPNTSGIPTTRAVVLDLLAGLIDLDLPNLHICVTSRPETDIKRVIESLPHRAVSLHDERGQKEDISIYVHSVVYLDRKTRNWRDEDKKLVVKELSSKADGIFRWAFCQLEVLRHCLPAHIRRTLNELPRSLDETYLRVLSQIPLANQAHTHRMLQCLVVAVRPLRVEELAGLLALDFDTAQGGIPRYQENWRSDDPTQAVLSTCSSLVTVVDDPWNNSQVIQLSHFSVMEFLMSDRLTSPLGNFSRYHISPGSAHTLLTQACLGSLLQLDNHIDRQRVEGNPLSQYAAQHWVEHAQFEGIASRMTDAMEVLFDSDKPHFSAWIGIYDLDTKFFWSYRGIPNPLYYSVLCGFYDLVKRLAIKYPHYVNAICGRYRLPLLAALGEGHVEIAELLVERGANVNVRELV